MDADEIYNFLSKHGSEDTKKEFVGVFASNELDDFPDYIKKMKDNKYRTPYCIVNTDRRSLNGTHWMCVLSIEPKGHVFLFDPFGMKGFMKFIRSDDAKYVDEFLTFANYSPYHVKGNSVDFGSVTFHPENAIKIKNSPAYDELSDMCRGFIEMMLGFSLQDKSKSMKIHCMIDQLQKINSNLCGVYCMYFIYNFFQPKNSMTHSTVKSCKIKEVESLCNEIFSEGSITGRNKNTKKMLTFANKMNIKGDYY